MLMRRGKWSELRAWSADQLQEGRMPADASDIMSCAELRSLVSRVGMLLLSARASHGWALRSNVYSSAKSFMLI